jgi:protoporphyrinogen oxidase
MNVVPRIGVVGAGILGSAITMRLAQAGVDVTLLERSDRPGGLAGTMDFGGSRVDRFYHVIVPSDQQMIGLIDELGLSHALSFSPVGAGFYIDGTMYPFNGIGDFLRFPALTPAARARLAWFVVQCQLRKRHDQLDGVPLEPWLRRHCGDEVTDRIWRPLLDSRFDGAHDELPATYLWARTNRMRSARTHGGGEQMGCLTGGHETLIDAMIERSRGLGAEICLGAGVESLALEDDAVVGVSVDGELRRFDQTIVTLQPQALRHLLPQALSGLLSAYPVRYLGVVCLVLKVRQTLLPYYSVNICDPTPITTVVETSHVVGRAHTDGLRLVYLPKYCAADAPEFTEADESIYRRFTGMLAKIAPAFDHADVIDWTVQRAPIVEPVHALGHEPRVAPVWPSVPGLALASASQVYPRLLNGESLVRLAETVVQQALTRVSHQEPLPVVA